MSMTEGIASDVSAMESSSSSKGSTMDDAASSNCSAMQDAASSNGSAMQDAASSNGSAMHKAASSKGSAMDTQQSDGGGRRWMVLLVKRRTLRRKRRRKRQRIRAMVGCGRAAWRCTEVLRDTGRSSCGGGDGGRDVRARHGGGGVGEARDGWKDGGRRDRGPSRAIVYQRRRGVTQQSIGGGDTQHRSG